MKNNVLTAILAATLLCGAAMANDGNMGAGGYTGCDGDNPPPTCECNVPNPPDTCQNTGGFASGQYSSVESTETDYLLAAEITGESIMSIF
jgi:hypothetical protein